MGKEERPSKLSPGSHTWIHTAWGLAEHFVAEVLGTDFHSPWGSLSEEDAKMFCGTLYFDHATDVWDKSDLYVSSFTF